jgi:RNA polymerase sigma factor (sigma-70 family)
MAEDLTEAERLEPLAEALRRLPEQRRAIFFAVTQDGVNYADVAERTGLTIGQVEREIARALLELDDAVHGSSRVPCWLYWLSTLAGRIRR